MWFWKLLWSGSLLHGSCSWKLSLPALTLLSCPEGPWASKVTTDLAGWHSVTSHLAVQYLKLDLVPRITDSPLPPPSDPLPPPCSEQMPVKTKTKTSSSSRRPGLSELWSGGRDSTGHCGTRITRSPAAGRPCHLLKRCLDLLRLRGAGWRPSPPSFPASALQAARAFPPSAGPRAGPALSVGMVLLAGGALTASGLSRLSSPNFLRVCPHTAHSVPHQPPIMPGHEFLEPSRIVIEEQS